VSSENVGSYVLCQRADLLLAVTSLEPLDTTASGGGGTSLTISDCEEILTDAHLGDSISVNGMKKLIASWTPIPMDLKELLRTTLAKGHA